MEGLPPGTNTTIREKVLEAFQEEGRGGGRRDGSAQLLSGALEMPGAGEAARRAGSLQLKGPFSAEGQAEPRPPGPRVRSGAPPTRGHLNLKSKERTLQAQLLYAGTTKTPRDAQNRASPLDMHEKGLWAQG